MTKAHEQMTSVIQSGIDGWIEGMFSSGFEQTDSLTGYPLTRETARVYYHSTYAYKAIVEAFLEGYGYPEELSARLLQAWVNYHWQYARLELSEDFSNVHIEFTQDMLDRRQSLRDDMVSRGYKQVKQ